MVGERFAAEGCVNASVIEKSWGERFDANSAEMMLVYNAYVGVAT